MPPPREADLPAANRIFVDRDEPAGARPLYERALAIYEKVLGAEHPLTGTIRENLRQANGETPTR